MMADEHRFITTGAPPPTTFAAETIFEIGSITSVFTAILLCLLVEDGKVDPRAPLRHMADDLAGVPDWITPERSVTHASGWPNFYTPLWKEMMRSGPGELYAKFPRSDLLAWLEGWRGRAPGPCPRHAYSNLGIGLLGEAMAMQEDVPCARVAMLGLAVYEAFGSQPSHSVPQRRPPVQHLKIVADIVDTYTFADMRKRDHMGALFRRATALAAFTALLWAVQVVNWTIGYGLNPAFGLIPRHLSGLDGVIAMPLLHGSFAHLMANTPPLLVMGGLLVATATRALLAVNAVVIGLGGSLVWLFGSSAVHIGTSGLVFGWFGFLVARGLVDRSPVTLGAALLVGFLYSSILWGVLPGQPGVSWEAHLFGFISGAAAAYLVRTHVHAPRIGRVNQE